MPNNLEAQLADNGAYSDLKIVCGADTYQVHKAIICPQSDFFRAACRPDTFQEGKTGLIDIPASSGRDDNFLTQPIRAEDFDWDLDVETTTSIKLMIHYFYHQDYLEQEKSAERESWYNCQCRKGILAEHSRMYAMGEKYGIHELKAVALAKFRNSAYKGCDQSGLAAAIVIAFKSTPQTDTMLRETILKILDYNGCHFRCNAEIQGVISGIPDLAYGLYCKALERLER
ncbi:unnamed protein product [Aureobasidium uvarum]|uniref:BTB domain-containing protein n=1 Tax=Aureobasidium uvarum TaxID=2773716 RepID=A0A9N8PQE1_9PEZI|nr:unnamed protein product [Aureobasidium uvarum]